EDATASFATAQPEAPALPARQLARHIKPQATACILDVASRGVGLEDLVALRGRHSNTVILYLHPCGVAPGHKTHHHLLVPSILCRVRQQRAEDQPHSARVPLA